MPATTVEAKDLSARFSELLVQAAAGTEIIVTEENVPKAKLVVVAAEPKKPRTPGLHRGAYVIADDFDAPLPDEFWLGESP